MFKYTRFNYRYYYYHHYPYQFPIMSFNQYRIRQRVLLSRSKYFDAHIHAFTRQRRGAKKKCRYRRIYTHTRYELNFSAIEIGVIAIIERACAYLFTRYEMSIKARADITAA